MAFTRSTRWENNPPARFQNTEWTDSFELLRPSSTRTCPKARALRGERTLEGAPQAEVFVTQPDNSQEPSTRSEFAWRFISACRDFESNCSAGDLADETLKNLYDGVKPEEIERAMILAARTRIEQEPKYTFVAAEVDQE